MEILSKQLQKQVRLVSKKLGVDEREVVNRAVSSYLADVDELVKLQQELRTWDILSVKTMLKYGF